jgi:hypothetical protein
MANTRRENRLEELGRVDAEKAYTAKGRRNLKDEKHRIRKELKRGGRAGKPWGHGPKPGSLEFFQSTTQTPKRKGKAKGGRAGFKHGKWVTTPTSHADIEKYVSHGKETGDIRRVELSTMKMPKVKKRRSAGPAAGKLKG